MFLIDDIEVRQTAETGRGVFATKDIPAGTVIAEYTGVLQPTGTCKHGDAVYEFVYSDTVDICPDITTVGMHLVNHSCEANCATGPLGRRTLLFALRRIFAGEELSYDYFMGVQEKGSKPGFDNCHCGSPYCRGTMYSNPEQYTLLQEWEDEEYKDESNDPPVPFGEMLPKLDSYPKEIEDDPLFSIFGCRMQKAVEGELALLSDPKKLRAKLRETGRQIAIPEAGVVVEGILFNESVVVHSV